MSTELDKTGARSVGGTTRAKRGEGRGTEFTAFVVGVNLSRKEAKGGQVAGDSGDCRCGK